MAKSYKEWKRISNLCKRKEISFSEAGKRGALVRKKNFRIKKEKETQPELNLDI